MAVEKDQTRAPTGIPSLVCTGPFLAGMVLLYVGERLVGAPLKLRLILDAAGIVCILWGLCTRLVNRARTQGDRRSVEGMILASTLGGIVALLLYALQLEPVCAGLRGWLDGPQAVDRYRVILQVLWPIVWTSAAFSLIFMEISYASMARSAVVERRRVAFSAGSGLAIAWLLAILFLANYLFDAHNRKWDLSYLKSTNATQATRQMVQNLSQDFEVILFFPQANEVCDQLLSYLEPLRAISPHLIIKVYDQVLEPRLAKELGARNNGTLIFRLVDKKETLFFDPSLEKARTKLSDLDEEFQKTFLRLAASSRVAYFTTGHGERTFDWSGEKTDTRPPVKGLRTILRSQNFQVKPLGIGQGLGAEVPEDASLVMVVDPTEDFLSEELAALRRYLARGGRLWVALEPGHSSDITGILEEYGLVFTGVPLANDEYFLRAYYNKADHYNLWTDSASSHASVSTLSRSSSRRVAVVLPEAGYLEKIEKGDQKGRVTITLRSMSMTWADTNPNMEADMPEEKRKTYDLAAAVTAPVQPSGVETPGDGDAGKEARMLVVADSDLLSDRVMGNRGNYLYFLDGLKWLFEEEKFVGSVTPEKDVRIVHTKKKDVLWFYGTIFVVPILVMAVGIFYNGIWVRRRPRSRAGGNSKP